MMGKRTFYCEIAYVIGIVVLALGTAFMERADFGLSMVVAPAYLLHVKISQYLPFFSFGIAGYVFQFVLLTGLSIVIGKVKRSYVLCFMTVFIYGIVLDVIIKLVSFIPYTGVVSQHVFYVVGLVTCATGVAFLLHTYFPPEAYDLTVKEISKKFNVSISKTKTIYDLTSCILAIVLTLCFFGEFVGVKWGTIVCALVNGFLIGVISRFLDNHFIWKDAFKLRSKIQ